MVSIIIPIFNKSEYIKQTIESIKKQSCNNWECLIIDDFSSDNSVEVVEYLVKGNNQFKLFKNSENKGANFCRNIGVNKSKGDYIIFLDADDVLVDNCISSRLEILVKNKELDFGVFPVGTFYNKIGDSNYVWNDFKGNHVDRFLCHDLPWLICSVMWRKKSIVKSYGFCEEFQKMQDVEFHTRHLVQHNSKYETFSNSKADCFYRINSKRIINGFDFCMKDISSKILFVNKFNTLLKKYNPKKIRLLTGTVFECLNLIFNFHKKGLINKQELEKLLLFFSNNDISLDQNYISKNFMYLYLKLRKRNIYFKGMNKLFKLVIQIDPISKPNVNSLILN